MTKSLVNGELVLAIDFDGTVTTEPDISDKPLKLQPNCKRVLTKLHEDGIRLILWTCRSGKALEDALSFLKGNDMMHLFDTVNEQLPEVVEKYYPDVALKVGADFYIDDKNLMFKVNWNKIEQYLYGESEYEDEDKNVLGFDTVGGM